MELILRTLPLETVALAAIPIVTGIISCCGFGCARPLTKLCEEEIKRRRFGPIRK